MGKMGFDMADELGMSVVLMQHGGYQVVNVYQPRRFLNRDQITRFECDGRNTAVKILPDFRLEYLVVEQPNVDGLVEAAVKDHFREAGP